MTVLGCILAVAVCYGVFYICGRAIEYGKKEGIVHGGQESDRSGAGRD